MIIKDGVELDRVNGRWMLTRHFACMGCGYTPELLKEES